MGPDREILRGAGSFFNRATSGKLIEWTNAGQTVPDGKLGAIAAVHTFGDYLIFQPHLHVLAADGLFTPDGRFHCMPAEDLDPATQTVIYRSKRNFEIFKAPDFDWFNRPRNSTNPDADGFDHSPGWKPEEVQLDDGRTLVLECN